MKHLLLPKLTKTREENRVLRLIMAFLLAIELQLSLSVGVLGRSKLHPRSSESLGLLLHLRNYCSKHLHACFFLIDATSPLPWWLVVLLCQDQPL